MTHDAAPLVILGVDPGTRVTGWGVIAVRGDAPQVRGCGVITPPARRPIEQRLQQIFSELGDVIAEHNPHVMAIEQPFVGTNVRSAMAVEEARTVAMLAASLAGLQVRHYPPARIKQSVAGYGQGDKEQVRQMLLLQLGAAADMSDLNATDALAVALCHAAEARAESIFGESTGRADGRPYATST
jgi:crossover junction endodeoxyribonuclease RuvC